MAYRIVLVGGGTGGHVYPLSAVVRELKRIAGEQNIDLQLQMWGDGVFMKQAAQELNVPYKKIYSPKWRRYFSVQNFLDLFKIPLGILQSAFYMWIFVPDIVFAKGSYTSVIPAIMAKIFMTPVIIHESDSIPGRANMLLGKMAKRIYISFEASRKYFKNEITYTVGNPVRTDIYGIPRGEALSFFGLSDTKPVVLIVGGSQGAQVINETIIESVVELVNNFHIIHQTGSANFESIHSQIEKIVKEGEKSLAVSYGLAVKESYKPYPFFDSSQIRYAYSAADIIISRAGASSLFEIALVGKPGIVIPILNSASNHQLSNAKEFAAYGGILIEEPNLTTHILIDQMKEAYKKREELSKKISEFARPDAAARIAEGLLGIV